MKFPSWARRTAIALALVLAGVVAFYAFLQTGPGQRTVAALIESAASSDDLKIKIEGLDGALPGAPHVAKLTLADADGPWLVVEDVRVEWRPFALLFGEIVVNDIAARRIDWLREPVSSDSEASSGGGGLPALAVKKLKIDTVAIAPAIVGRAGAFSIDGAVDLLDPADEAQVQLNLVELNGGPARATVDAVYAPARNRLDLNAAVEDAAGGVLARMLNLPPEAALSATLTSTGALDNWNADLKATGGDALNASGRARIVRDKEWRRLSLTLTADVAAIGPERLRPLYQGKSDVDVEAALSDTGAIAVDRLAAATPAITLESAGLFGATKGQAVGTATLRLPNARALAPLIGADTKWRSLVMTARLDGEWPAPTLIVGILGADLAASDASASGVDVRLEATPDKSWGAENARIAVTARASIQGFTAADATLRDGVGPSPSLSLQGTLVDRARLTNITSELTTAGAVLRFAGEAGETAIQGAASIDAPDLSRAGLAGGAMKLRVNIDADLDSGAWNVEGNGEAQDVTTGDAVDGLLAGKQKLNVAMSGTSFRDVRISSLALGGDRVSLIASGTATQDALNLDSRIVVPELGVLSPEQAGRAEIELHAGGSANAPRVSGTATLTNGKLLARAVRSLQVKLMAPDANDMSRLSINGDYGDKPVDGTAKVAWQKTGGARIDDLRLVFASVSLAGNATVDEGGLIRGSIDTNLGDLADIAPFIDEDVSGALAGTLRFDVANAKQKLTLALEGSQFRIDTATLAELKTNGTIGDLFGAGVFDVRARAAVVDIDDFVIQDLDATGRGPLRALAVAATATRDGTKLNGSATLKLEGKPISIAVETLRLARDDKNARLTAPVELEIGEHHVRIPGARIAAGGGSAVVSGDAGRATDLAITATNLPLWVAAFVSEPLPATGSVSGTARIGQHGATSFDVKVANLAPADDPRLIRNLTVTANGQTDRTGVDFKLTLADRGNTSFNANGRIPFAENGALKVDARGTADLRLANVYLGVTGDRARGALTATANLSGTLGAPRIEGSGKIANGYFRSASSGFELKNIAAALEGSERSIAVTSLTAVTANGGNISGQGDIRLDPAAGYPINLAVKARKAQFVSTDLTTVVADVDARMTGGMLQNPTIAGTADIEQWEIRLPEKLARPLNPIRVTHRNAPADLAATLAAEDEEPANALDIALDVTVNAPRRVFVRGQGVDAEFGGQVKVAGLLDRPVANGKFELRRGAVSILNQRVSLTRGDITFAGDIVPTLDVAGEISKTDLTAIVAVKGKATSPEITLSSTPTVPQDEIIARIMFNKSVQQLSAFEAAQLAAAIARWSGLSTGPDILESLRSALGIDALSAVTDATGGTAVSAGSYVGSGVYVGFVQGADATAGRATVDIDLNETIKLRGEAGPSGDTRVGVVAEWEY